MTTFLDAMKKRASATAAARGDPNENQLRRVLDAVSAECEHLVDNLETMVEANASGESRHDPIGFINHRFKYPSGFPVSLAWPVVDFNFRFPLDAIKSAPGFVKLAAKCQRLGLQLELLEEESETLRIVPMVCISGWEPWPSNPLRGAQRG